MNTKCKICNKGSSYKICCGYDKETGKRFITFWEYLKNLFKIKLKNNL